ncbi:MAG: energy-coupling factor transporter transmembrane protein EcfT [Chloroflexi bacterium]|nr:MAG: energy-coupling factor transporter transmembrane protein EcfT [Chloroflexota bacterium]TMG71093.1 MAG: energy-coupling factor transporter transmembrane protein EcfT [Chloroflexota bacterium]
MSFLARRDPTVKLAVVLGISLLLIFVIDPLTPVLFLALAIAAALAGGAGLGTILRALLPLSILGVGFVWSNAVFAATQGPATWTIGPVHASEAGLRFGLAIAIRGIAIGMMSLAFVWTTDPTDLVVSLIQHARVPFRIGYPLLAGYRFLPFFADEYAQVRLARRVRGAVARGPLGRAREAVGELVTLLSDATRRATRIAIAMDARAFAAATERTYYREARLGWEDALFVVGSAAMTLGLLFLSARIGSLRTLFG